MDVVDRYCAWASQSKVRMYLATPLLAIILLAVLWSVVDWLF